MDTSILFLLGLGLTAAVILAVASRLLYVKEDPRIELVESSLAGANCGGCGYPGCAGAARAVVAGKEGADVCVIGGQEVMERVARVMGLALVELEPELAFHDCQGGERAADKYLYNGIPDCRAQSLLYDGNKVCGHGCLALGTCVAACPFDAMFIEPGCTPVIDENKCRACGICAEVCPRDVITVVSPSARILHMNTENECLAPCRQTCPAEINIPEYIEQVKRGEYREAVLTLKERNPLILSIGRVCPAPCEKNCRRGLVDDPVGINYIKRFAADWEMNSGTRVEIPIAPETGKKVAVIGGGPAGLSCAFFLRRLGHSPTILDMKPQLGGQLRYGIPEYRLPKHILDWEIEGILGLGIEARNNMEFGTDYTLESLKEEGFEAFFLSMGAWLNYTLRIEGEESKGVWGGTEYLTQIALGRTIEVGTDVVIVGGGNTAIDTARTARRMDANVTLMYRRTEADMPANDLEIQAAKEEGINMLFLAGPTRVISDANGHIAEVEYITMELGEPDASGRRSPIPKQGSEQRIKATTLITAVGQYPNPCYVEHGGAICEVTKRKTLSVNPITMQTTLPDVFAAGDGVTGPSLVITAIGGGRRAARGIHYYLMQGEIPVPHDILKELMPESLFTELPGIGRIPRAQQPEICVEDRHCNFREVEQTISEEEVRHEASRCMRCGSTCYDFDPVVETATGNGTPQQTDTKGRPA
ncbi:MAG: FAD-dependent oxidoreductase [Desulfovibrio sp.]|uniref:FAD-dependent oxidoreductase n=1 Tax=Desulfovibrio sp. 7SRBS1 TaxID=3378064 RepID=UPI003B3D2443